MSLKKLDQKYFSYEFQKMDRSYDISFSSYEDLSLSRHNSTRKGDISISDQLADFGRLCALSHAAEISPLVKEVTIGPNSPLKKDEYKDPVINIKEDKDEEDLIEDKVREDLRYTLIMKEYENKFQETAEGLFKHMVEDMIAKHTENMTTFLRNNSEECQRQLLQVKARKLQMLKELQQNDNLNVLNMARLDEQNCQVIKTQTIENMNRILEEQNRAMARMAAITASRTNIWICFNDITHILETEPLAKPICNKYTSAIHTTLANIDHVMVMCQKGEVTDKDVKQSEVLVLNIENIKKKILEEINLVKREEILNKQKEEDEIKKKELERRKAEEIKLAQIAEAERIKREPPKQIKPVFYSASNYSYYENLKNYLEQYEAQYKDLLQDANLKKFRFDCQKAVNTPVNALSSVSASHMRDKYEKLSKLLKGDTVQVLDTYVKATTHPQGLFYCTALLAKKIVRQGDLLVSSNTEAAYPLAAVTAALWAQYPHFGKLVEAYFHRLCPYLVPMFLPQKEGQSDKEFYMSRGYTYNDEGVVEKQDKFLKRMSGIFRLRCAIWIAAMPRFLNNIPNPHGVKYGWHWLASFLNLKPEPDISATLVHDFFIMCGSKFNKHYGKQFKKILELTSNQYLKILENIDEGGPKTRLEVYLQTVLKTNDVPAPPSSTQLSW